MTISEENNQLYKKITIEVFVPFAINDDHIFNEVKFDVEILSHRREEIKRVLLEKKKENKLES